LAAEGVRPPLPSGVYRGSGILPRPLLGGEEGTLREIAGVALVPTHHANFIRSLARMDLHSRVDDAAQAKLTGSLFLIFFLNNLWAG